MIVKNTNSNSNHVEPSHAEERAAFKRNDLAAWDLLQRPIWVFDCETNSMFWANKAGLRLWNASSREEFLARDYDSDMSDAVKSRCRTIMRRIENGEVFTEQWTYYPNGKPTTTEVGHSAIWIDAENGEPPYLAVVNECFSVQSVNDDVAAQGLRSIEMLRHLPEPVGEFDSNGNVVTQNPEAMELFGNTSFADRFVDPEVGREFLTSVLDKGVSVDTQVQQITLEHGPRWFDLRVRARRDPVTAEAAVLYSARDITAILETEAKSELLSVIAHEIRTPLHQINGFAELLELTELNTQQQEYEAMIKQSCFSMMGVINDVLDFSKVESGKLQLESVPFDVISVSMGTVSAITPSAEKKGLQIHHDFDNRIPAIVVGDPNRLRQVLSNLLNNAMKFTEAGSVSVTISSKPQPDDCALLLFSVTDTGIGISHEGQAVVFDKYRQASVSISRKYGGTGLGLAICKSLVELMGGEIGVKSVVNQGSTFWFEVPFTVPVSHPNLTSTETATMEKNDLSWHILVAEDNTICQKLVKTMLMKLGHTIHVVNDGIEAVNAVLDPVNSFDLVLMDIQMPNMDGFEATKHIRESFTPADLPVIGLTADFLSSEMSKYTDVGMNSCLGKPTRLTELREYIHIMQAD